MNANAQYRKLLIDVALGPFVSPRGQLTREFMGYVTQVNMWMPLVTIPSRKISYSHMLAEAAWILGGERILTPGVERLLPYSDDGRTMAGAYGPPFLQQVPYVVDKLSQDICTRQAVMTLWERSPRESRDVPCTVAMQFFFRDRHIHTNVFMRSSDVWLGWPYDVFCFTMMTWHVSLCIRGRPTPGTLTIFAGSQHLYDRNRDESFLVREDLGGDNLAMDLSMVNTPADLLACLRGANDDHRSALDYIKEELCP